MQGMVGSLEQLVANLPVDLRDRVLERAAILWESGMAEDDATRRAYELETDRSAPKQVLAGLARAKDRTDEATDDAEPRSGGRSTG
jgi:hypothetical protein